MTVSPQGLGSYVCEAVRGLTQAPVCKGAFSSHHGERPGRNAFNVQIVAKGKGGTSKGAISVSIPLV